MTNTDLNDRVLATLCAQADHCEGCVVDARGVAAELKIEPRDLYAAVVALVESDFLVYRGAGPRVEITKLGGVRCRQLVKNDRRSDPAIEAH